MAGVLDILKAIAPTALAVGGTLIQRNARRKAEKNQAQELLRQLQAATDTSRQNRELTVAGAEQYEPTRRVANFDQIATQRGADFSDQLDALTTRDAGREITGKVSDDFLAGRAKEHTAALKRGHQVARLMGALGTNRELNQGEAFRNADLASQRQTNSSTLNNTLTTGGNRLAGIQPNGTQMIVGDLARGAGVVAGMRKSPRLTLAGAQ